MTEDEAFNILGGKGTITTDSAFGEGEYAISSTAYQYSGKGSIGGMALIIIQNGKVTSKSQYGLK